MYKTLSLHTILDILVLYVIKLGSSYVHTRHSCRSVCKWKKSIKQHSSYHRKSSLKALAGYGPDFKHNNILVVAYILVIH